eukprot:643720-Pleurochrysis_carterae.AAC.1
MGCATATGMGTVFGDGARVGGGNMSGAGRSEARALAMCATALSSMNSMRTTEPRQGALRECDAGTLMAGAHGNHVWHGPERSVSGVNEDWRTGASPVCRMLEYVLCSSVSCSREDGNGASYRFVRGRKFARRVLSAANDWRAAVRRGARTKVPRDGESRARRRSDNSRVFAGSAALEKSLVNGVPQDIMFVPSAVSPVLVNGVALHPES